MLDFNSKSNNFMKVKLKNGFILSVEEPNLKVLALLEAAQNSGETKDIIKAITTMLNRNKQKKKYRFEDIEEMFTVSEMRMLLEAYGSFAQEIANDPN